MSHEKIAENKTNETKQLQSAGTASMMPPAMQLQASTAAEEKAPTDIGSLENPASYTSLSPVKMHDIAKELSQKYDSADSKVEKFKLARVLYPIYQTLSSRGVAAVMATPPDYTDEIWKVVGGPGDPMAGMLESTDTYKHAFDWEAAIKDYDPRSWNETVVNGAYLANKAKDGGARATNFNTGIEEARSLIGKEVTEIGKDGKPKKRTFSPEIKSGSEWGEKNSSLVKNPDFDLTLEEMMKIVDEGRVKQSIDGRIAERKAQAKAGKPLSPEPPTMAKVHDEVGKFIKSMQMAFRLAKIDTVQGQAAYLAHAAGETLFLALTEGQQEMLESDQHKLHYKAGTNGPLDYARSSANAELHGSTHSVDPLGVIKEKDKMKKMGQEDAGNIMDQTFIGRGPVQVTHDFNYAQTLIYMEELAKKATDPKDADLLWEAILEIKRDPSQAANPKYSFLFSAAYMQKTGGLRASSGLGNKVSAIASGAKMSGSQHALFDWVSGGMEIGERAAGSLSSSVKEAANRKVATYNIAFDVITEHIKKNPKP